MNSAELAAVRLALVRGVGPRTRRALLAALGAPESVLAAPLDELRRVRGVGPELARRLRAARQEIDVEDELATCRRQGITILLEQHPGYPRLLREIHDPPGVLFVAGAMQPRDALAVAIVGTRHATHYGRVQAERLAAGLARSGVTIVSGLARGIDAAAHRGALQAGGRTLAVLGSGVLNIYPPEHGELARAISRQGAVLSEAPPRSHPLSGAFPQRNRLISGLSLGLIVVEAAERSGALISAAHAMQQGREVFAVPGRIDSRSSRGCHRLIRDGARLVDSVDDVLEELGPLVEPVPSDAGRTIQHPHELQLNEQEAAVLGAVSNEPRDVDQVLRECGLSVSRALATLSVLEMRRLVHRLPGNRVTRRADVLSPGPSRR